MNELIVVPNDDSPECKFIVNLNIWDYNASRWVSPTSLISEVNLGTPNALKHFQWRLGRKVNFATYQNRLRRKVVESWNRLTSPYEMHLPKIARDLYDIIKGVEVPYYNFFKKGEWNLEVLKRFYKIDAVEEYLKESVFIDYRCFDYSARINFDVFRVRESIIPLIISKVGNNHPDVIELQNSFKNRLPNDKTHEERVKERIDYLMEITKGDAYLKHLRKETEQKRRKLAKEYGIEMEEMEDEKMKCKLCGNKTRNIGGINMCECGWGDDLIALQKPKLEAAKETMYPAFKSEFTLESPKSNESNEFKYAVTVFNDHPIFQIWKGDSDMTNPREIIMAFGLRKAKMLVGSMDGIKQFIEMVEKNGNSR